MSGNHKTWICLLSILMCLGMHSSQAQEAKPKVLTTESVAVPNPDPDAFATDILAARAAAKPKTVWVGFLLQLEVKHPYCADWLLQDVDGKDGAAWLEEKNSGLFPGLCVKVAREAGSGAPAQAAADERSAILEHIKVCEKRWAQRLQPLLEKTKKVIFSKFNDIISQGYSVNAATGGKNICLLEFDGI